ncbi:DEKNAAC105311 [Brettanomyces naardenensis]|uniref:DEKNAAC105311 n=1 Tax=Brettanomyces naardenensis TaxID=13370 RepID=A0A448YTG5_BRENA|nr:DEKNAAC105311 [Brettanomyces naardenensis]
MTVDKHQSYVFQNKVSDKGLLCVGTKNDGMSIVLEDPKTKERKVLLDGISGAAVCSLGHNDPEIIDHLSEYAKESAYTFGGHYGNYASEDLSKFLCDKSNGLFSSCLWTGSGSEANENAMKIMRQYFLEKGDNKRYKFISRKQAYHGFTIGALSIGDNTRKPPFEPILLSAEQTPKLAACYPYRGIKEGMTEEDYTKELLADAEKVFIDNDPSTICGVIVETVGGSTIGTPTPPKGYLDGLRDIAHKYGALFMCDEVMCGLGRCGYPFTFQHPDFGLSSGGPDLISVGKTIGSGYVTLAGVMISPKVVDAFEEGTDQIIGAQTYHCHAFNCRVGLAVQEKIYRDHLIDNVRILGNQIKKELKEQLKDCRVAGDVRGAGNFLTVEAVKDRKTKEPFDPSLKIGSVLEQKCFDKGLILMGASGTIYSKQVGDNKVIGYGDHCTIGPAFCFTKEQAEFIVKTIVEAFKEVEKEQLD